MRKASVVSMNSVFHYMSSNAQLNEQNKKLMNEDDLEKQTTKSVYGYYGSWKNKNLAMPWAMIVISFLQVDYYFPHM